MLETGLYNSKTAFYHCVVGLSLGRLVSYGIPYVDGTITCYCMYVRTLSGLWDGLAP